MVSRSRLAQIGQGCITLVVIPYCGHWAHGPRHGPGKRQWKETSSISNNISSHIQQKPTQELKQIQQTNRRCNMQQTTACVGFFVGSGVLPKVISSSCCSALLATEYSKAMHCLALLSCVIAIKVDSAPGQFWNYVDYRLFRHDTHFIDHHQLQFPGSYRWPAGIKWFNPQQQQYQNGIGHLHMQAPDHDRNNNHNNRHRFRTIIRRPL